MIELWADTFMLSCIEVGGDDIVLQNKPGARSPALIGQSCPGSVGLSSRARAEKLLQATSRHTTNTPNTLAPDKSKKDLKTLRSKIELRTQRTMASRVLRPALRVANSMRGFQTSAVLRQEKPLVAPVRRPVGAFRGG